MEGSSIDYIRTQRQSAHFSAQLLTLTAHAKLLLNLCITVLLTCDVALHGYILVPQGYHGGFCRQLAELRDLLLTKRITQIRHGIMTGRLSL